MVTINLTDKMPLDKALRKFKKELQKEDTIATYLEHTRFVKPSTKKRQKTVHMKHVLKKIAEEEAAEAVKAKYPSRNKDKDDETAER
jgi:ribosomal protein S21